MAGGFCSCLCNLLSGRSGTDEGLGVKLTDAEQGVELAGIKGGSQASPKARSKGSLMFAKRKEAEAEVAKQEEAVRAPVIETLPPVISLPVEKLEKGSWKVQGLYLHQVLIIGLRHLDDTWSVEGLLDFPRRPNGTPFLLREKIIKDLISGGAKIKSLAAGDIQAAQGDLQHLTLRQLLRLRVLHLDFTPGSSSANNVNTVGEASAAFITKVDLLLFQNLSRHATKDILGDSSNEHLKEKIDSACRSGVLGHELTLIVAVGASISDASWWVWWIDDQRIYFQVERFTCAIAFPSCVSEIADSSSPDGNGRTWFSWNIRLISSESQVGLTRSRAGTGPDNAKVGTPGTPKAGAALAPGLSAELLANTRGLLKKTKTPDT